MAKFKKPKPKREPLLLDAFLAKKVIAGEPLSKWAGRLQDRLQDAKVFVLDKQAAIYAAQFIKNHPEAIATDQEFAIPPFDRMYVELPFEAFFNELGSKGFFDAPNADTEVGYFFDGPDCFVMSQARNLQGREGSPLCLPIVYHRNKPFTVEAELAMAEAMQTSRIGIDGMLWGSSLQRFHEAASPMARALRENHSFEWWPEVRGVLKPNELDHLAKVSAGDMRNIIALTLFLNRTREVRIEDTVPPAMGFVGNKLKPYVKHNIVRIKLDPKPMLARVYAHTGTQRREHDCRGHFCHDKVARASGHHVGALPGTEKHPAHWTEYGVNQWRCLVCGGKRWHRKEHKRGHKEVGKVKKVYEVTK